MQYTLVESNMFLCTIISHYDVTMTSRVVEFEPLKLSFSMRPKFCTEFVTDHFSINTLSIVIVIIVATNNN